MKEFAFKKTLKQTDLLQTFGKCSSRPFVSNSSPKWIDREGLGKSRTGTRQDFSQSYLRKVIFATFSGSNNLCLENVPCGFIWRFNRNFPCSLLLIRKSYWFNGRRYLFKWIDCFSLGIIGFSDNCSRNEALKLGCYFKEHKFSRETITPVVPRQKPSIAFCLQHTNEIFFPDENS